MYVICPFPLVTFNILSLSLIFVSLITLCFDVFLLGFILPGTLCASWIWLIISFPMLGNFSALISSNIFSGPFSLSYPSVTLIMRMRVCLLLFQRPLKLSSFIFILFSYSFFRQLISNILSSSSFFRASALVFVLWIPYSVLFISIYLFFSSHRSLVNISYIFSIQASILFPRS